MTYTNPLATIASIGIQSTPIPTIQMTSSAPTTRANGGALQAGDEWWEPVTNIQYIWLTDTTPSRWQAVGGAGFVTGLVSDNPSIVPYTLPTASSTILGGVKVGSSLTITDGVLAVNPVLNPIQTLNVTGTSTLHTIVTGADAVTKVAVNANAGIIQTKFINLTTNPTTDTSDSNYGVSLRATGEIIGQWANLTVNPDTNENDVNYGVSLRTTGTIVTPEENVTTISGARQGVVYKLVSGDGLSFDGQASTHIGGTVGNDWSTSSGTIKVNATVLRTTDTQTITGDLVVAKGTIANPSRLGTVSNTQNKLTENYADAAAAGTPTLGTLAVIDGVLCFGDGTNWKIITLGGNV